MFHCNNVPRLHPMSFILKSFLYHWYFQRHTWRQVVVEENVLFIPLTSQSSAPKFSWFISSCLCGMIWRICKVIYGFKYLSNSLSWRLERAPLEPLVWIKTEVNPWLLSDSSEILIDKQNESKLGSEKV